MGAMFLYVGHAGVRHRLYAAGALYRLPRTGEVSY